MGPAKTYSLEEQRTETGKTLCVSPWSGAHHYRFARKRESKTGLSEDGVYRIAEDAQRYSKPGMFRPRGGEYSNQKRM